MGLRPIVKALDRLVGRFNRWLAPAAIASGAEVSPGQGVNMDPGRVAAILGEIERGENDDGKRAAG